MTNAGERDSTLPRYNEVAKAYVKYDCSTSTLCVLALADDGYIFEPVGDDTWVKDYDIGTSILPPLAITDVYENGNVVGWEGCFSLASGCHDNIEIHANWGEPSGATGNTASTGKYARNSDNVISLNLQCAPPSPAPSRAPRIPPPTPAPTPGLRRSPPTPDPTPAQLLDEFCTPTDLSICPIPSNICSKASCTDGQCGFELQNQGGGCDPTYEPEEGGCTEGYFCEGLDCVLKYKEVNTECTTHTVPSANDAICTKGLCNSSGVCEVSFGRILKIISREEMGICVVRF